MKIYEPAAQIIEHVLLDYEQNPDKFIPTSHSTIEDDNNNIPPDIDITDENIHSSYQMNISINYV